MLAVAIGDAHFDGNINNLVEDGPHFVYNELRGPCNYAANNGIKHIFMLGDTCNKPRMSYESHTALLRLFDAFPELHFHIILGNHDLYGEDPRAGHSMQLIMKTNRRNVSVYTKPTKKLIDGCKVQFLPYPHRSFDPTALNIAHVDVSGAVNDNGRPVKSEDASNAVCVIGHIHTAQQVRRSYYPGTLYQTRYSEKEDKFFALIRFNNTKDYDIQLRRHDPAVLLRTLIVKTREDLEQADPDPRILYRLILQDGAEVSPEDWSHLNTRQTNTFRTKEDLKAMMNVEHAQGEAIRISVPEFLEAHFVASGMPIDKAQKLLALRESILKAA